MVNVPCCGIVFPWDHLLVIFGGSLIPLDQLLANVPALFQGPIPDLRVGGVALDSRQVKPGDLFVALVGENMDGHRFVPEAVARGAAAVVGTHKDLETPVPYFRVADGRKALAHLAAAFHGFPARELTVIGITGTDGKTSTANLIYEILQAAGRRVGLVSTVNALIGSETLDTGFHVTTPEAPDVQEYLARMVSAGMGDVILEATSHGLAQDRLEACEFDVGVVTNITHEHLDYHGSFEAYRAAKARLFESLSATAPKPHQPPSVAVLNRDDPSYAYLAGRTTVRQISYGRHPEAQVQITEVRSHPDGQEFTILGPAGARFAAKTTLPGAFNLGNCLAAFAVTVYGLDVSPDAAVTGLARVTAIPGRLERLDLGQSFYAYVDFAHTPNALQKILETAREFTVGRVIAVFGSAGLRDKEKRRMMAEISAGSADLTVLTAEDPRTEDLDGILEEMAAGAVSAGGVEGKSFWRVPDRREALRFAVALAEPGDVVIACGKGHEQSMCFGAVEYPWDDRVALRAAISEHLGVSGPDMPYLPTQFLE